MSCKLCKDHKADKRGSHIASLFIIASMLANEGKARVKGITAVVSSSSLLNVHFERGVLPEKINDLFGRDLTDNEIQNNLNPLVQDYFLCTNCEDKLQRLEDLVASEVYSKLDTFNKQSVKGNSIIQLLPFHYKALQLLLLSIVWRGSVVQYANFELRPPLEEKIRIKLIHLLSLEKSKLIASINEDIETEDEFVMLTCLQSDIGNSESKTGNIVNFYNIANSPYYITINEFVICLYDNDKSVNATPQGYFGFEKNFTPALVKELNGSNSLLLIEQINWLEWLRNMFKESSKEFMEYYRRLFVDLYKEVTKTDPTDSIVDRFMFKLGDSEDRGDRYTHHHFAEVALGVIKGL